MQAEAVHDGFFLYRVRTRLEHEGIGIQLPAVVHEADCEAAGFLVHLEVDFDPLRVAIVMAALDDVHERLFQTELQLEPVLLPQPVPVGETVQRLRDPFELAAAVAHDQA